MKLAVVCCTFLRPKLLGELIESYLRQEYPSHQRELVILDDAGQYPPLSGDGWRLVSVAERFPTLGAKRNACAALVSDDVDGLVVADDDDIYLPHWLTAHAETLQRSPWSVPSRVFLKSGTQLRRTPNWEAYHSGWAYRRTLFEQLGGYAELNNGEDQELAERIRALGVKSADPCEHHSPFLLYRLGASSYQAGNLHDAEFAGLSGSTAIRQDSLHVRWDCDYTALVAEAS